MFNKISILWRDFLRGDIFEHAVQHPVRSGCAIPGFARYKNASPEKIRLNAELLYRLRNNLKFLIMMLLVSNPCLLLADQKADDYVKAADQYRQSNEAMQIESLVELFKNGQLSKRKSYRVYVRPERKSLVVMLSPSEKGQKILMLGDKFWILMPKSRRPIRITPMQKLLGEASTGDIATLNWHEDFSAEFIQNSELLADKNQYDVLLLTSKRKGATYYRIKLWLQKNSHKPSKAELYVKSGKLAKIARFKIGKIKGQERVVSMILEDRIKKNRKTIIHYQSMKKYTLPKKYFNPSYLVKNPDIPDA